MTMELSNLRKLKSHTRKAKRLGRGIGSGKGGHTVGRGHKGQKSRAGKTIPAGFEGGQTPLYKRFPRIHRFKTTRAKADLVIPISLTKLNVFKAGSTVTPESLVDKKIIKKLPSARGGVKVLGVGRLSKKLNLKGFSYSEAAKSAVSKLGGKSE